MSCYQCAASESLEEKARVSALEKQNTDLIAIVRELMTRQLLIRFPLDPNMHELRMGDYQDFMVKKASKLAAVQIEQMLEDRRKFFRDYDLLKMHATRDYWMARNEELLR